MTRADRLWSPSTLYPLRLGACHLRACLNPPSTSSSSSCPGACRSPSAPTRILNASYPPSRHVRYAAGRWPSPSPSSTGVLNRFLVPAFPESETKLDRNLLWTRLEIQGITTWTLVETGIVTNIISSRYSQSLHLHPRPRTTSPEMRLISGHKVALPLLGKVVLTFKVDGKPFSHIFYIIDNFPVEALLGSEFLKPHACSISYASSSRVSIGQSSCPTCISHFAAYGRARPGERQTSGASPSLPHAPLLPFSTEILGSTARPLLGPPCHTPLRVLPPCVELLATWSPTGVRVLRVYSRTRCPPSTPIVGPTTPVRILPQPTTPARPSPRSSTPVYSICTQSPVSMPAVAFSVPAYPVSLTQSSPSPSRLGEDPLEDFQLPRTLSPPWKRTKSAPTLA